MKDKNLSLEQYLLKMSISPKKMPMKASGWCTKEILDPV
jgi:hypothetical protein